MSRKRVKPLYQNIEVTDAGAKGKSIAKAPDGRIIFISNAVPGDVVDVQTYAKKKSYYEGKAVAFHKYSPKRDTPKCQHFGVCGGCKWQYMSYEHQLQYKQQEITNNLIRIGDLKLPKVSSIIPSTQKYFYRNKMEFSFSDSRWLSLEEIQSETELGDKNALGFHIPGRWDKVLNIEKCWLQENPSNAIRLAIKEFAVAQDLTFFNPRQQTGFLRTLMIRTSSTKEIMVLVQFFKEDKNKRELLLDHIRRTFPEITSLLYVINTKANDSIYDQEVFCYHGREFIFETMENLKFKINAKSFYQTNSQQAYELYKITRDFAGLQGDEIVYDLYSGIGTIAQFIAKEALKVIGIESVADAIQAANENMQLNNINNTEFIVGDMKTVLNTDFVTHYGKPDVIITDPPRNGMHKNVVQQILDIAPKKIVYVSCNSATQARDIALMKGTYKITKVQPVDMFPQTYHVENVILLEKITDNEN